MLLAIYALTLACLVYSVVTVRDLKGVLKMFITDANAKLDQQSGKIDAAATRVLAALAGVVSEADAAALIAKIDANSAKVDAFAAPAAAPAP